MLRHQASRVANDEQWLDPKLQHALLRDAPQLAGKVITKCHAENDTGHPEIARELLECAAQIARTIKAIDDH